MIKILKGLLFFIVLSDVGFAEIDIDEMYRTYEPGIRLEGYPLPGNYGFALKRGKAEREIMYYDNPDLKGKPIAMLTRKGFFYKGQLICKVENLNSNAPGGKIYSLSYLNTDSSGLISSKPTGSYCFYSGIAQGADRNLHKDMPSYKGLVLEVEKIHKFSYQVKILGNYNVKAYVPKKSINFYRVTKPRKIVLEEICKNCEQKLVNFIGKFNKGLRKTKTPQEAVDYIYKYLNYNKDIQRDNSSSYPGFNRSWIWRIPKLWRDTSNGLTQKEKDWLKLLHKGIPRLESMHFTREAPYNRTVENGYYPLVSNNIKDYVLPDSLKKEYNKLYEWLGRPESSNGMFVFQFINGEFKLNQFQMQVYYEKESSEKERGK